MNRHPDAHIFLSDYGDYKQQAAALAEIPETFEIELQYFWRTGEFPHSMKTCEGHRLRVLSPGWLNKQSGPDFINAQLEFNGTLYTGDVEIHRQAQHWYEHGHQHNPAYNNVLLHVVQSASKASLSAVTADGRKVATLIWPDAETLQKRRSQSPPSEYCGKCASAVNHRNTDAFSHFLALAGEWRILEKSRRLEARMLRVGFEQSVYEEFMGACGYSVYKEQFKRIAQALPYDRARQIAQQNPHALETALLHLGGLLPEQWDHAVPPPAHYLRLKELRQEQLMGLNSLEIKWSRSGSRPINAPERRLAGAAVFLTRTADYGLQKKLELFWHESMTPTARRRRMGNWFGGTVGFWASHCSWQGTVMQRPGAPLGSGRICSILGNVLIPGSLAWARDKKLRLMEEEVHALFANLPLEPENRIHRLMMEWMALDKTAFKWSFKHQQGLLQIHEDWCARNPSCANCTLMAFLRTLDAG